MTTLDERPAGGPQDAAAGRGRQTGSRAATARPDAAAGDAGPDAARPTEPRLRVVLLLDVLEGRQDQFLQAYERIRHQVAAVPGHISDQLCQSLGNSSQWLITSEWHSSEPFLEWVESAAHRAMVEPLHGCVRDTTSLRFVVTRETPDPVTDGVRPAVPATPPAAGPSLDPIPAPPLCSGGVVRHAITFTVKPGAEAKAAELLAHYESPSARVDDTTRLLRTSLFMHGNRIVRAVEVAGDLGNALRHVASQPGVRAVEEALTPYLEDHRDMTDAASARAFFARSALPAIAHTGAEQSGAQPAREVVRLAYVHATSAERGPDEARRLAAADAADCARDAHPLAAATCYQRGDVLVRVLDVAAGVPVPAELARGGRPLTPITDRTAADA